MIIGISEQRLREILREELSALFVRDVVMEKLDGTTETQSRDVIELLTMRLQHLEGRLQGMQSDVDQARNRVGELVEQQGLMVKTLLGLEQPMKRVAAFGDAVRPALEVIDAKVKELPPCERS